MPLVLATFAVPSLATALGVVALPTKAWVVVAAASLFPVLIGLVAGAVRPRVDRPSRAP
jgi:hypothetical protein